MKNKLLIYWIAWRFMLIPAIASSGLTLWLLWPLDIALWLAAGAGLAVFIIATFIHMALSIND